MITIIRGTARRLLAVLDRRVRGSHRGAASPPLVLNAEGRRLRARFQAGDLAVEYVESASGGELDSVPVALEALARVGGREDTTVDIESISLDRTAVRWRDASADRLHVSDHPVICRSASTRRSPTSPATGPA
ncbi:hypothetical protein OJF2_05600 [Aquisphaera giovannonii]|uniref:Uncharacterized protein n=1 Tax=Aquisphaera giovannonii TaxID=406548 RepID=A0A5B9VW60_9BACT|nr:hypothetical protein [Aquisphaera giovannonii]QEH32091.1 hypothetical protein OJF2_05600 [Aquisphaera giovannonii]